MKNLKHELKSVREVYFGSASADTNRLMRSMKLQPNGEIAALLLRAQKASSRAKKYRGGLKDGPSFRYLAYQKKNECLRQLCEALNEQSDFTWGWGIDEAQTLNLPKHVLYIELPTGQASFHNFVRHEGPDFLGEWDRAIGVSEERIIEFCSSVMESPPD